MRVGIFFGGQSREREVSFAGGRTVFDNLDKQLFEAIPVFIDSLGNFILLDWQHIYKGTIRDFYPPAGFLQKTETRFQLYIESLNNLSREEFENLIASVGKRIYPHEFKDIFDLAFLTLHGNYGEDGNIQGILEWHGIPYTGAGILPSAIGVNKDFQQEFLKNAGFARPKYELMSKNAWLKEENKANLLHHLVQELGLPIVIKSPHQGSSIGVTILKEENLEKFIEAIHQSLFILEIKVADWKKLNAVERDNFFIQFADVRYGLGFPVMANTMPEESIIYHTKDLESLLENSTQSTITLTALQHENSVLFEQFIQGKEFSCIVIEDEDGEPIALPPTEIRKFQDFFDYRSKYLPGTSRKITPIEIKDEWIEQIREACCRLYKTLYADVYARIDGFITDEGKIFLNDPNTTSGMLPSSFFFHQAAEIGLNPSQFLSYIIVSSLKARIRTGKNSFYAQSILSNLEKSLSASKNQETHKKRVAVIMGGYSTERHISMESGRNIYEKLASSKEYAPFPVFLTGNEQAYELYIIPVNILLKDNADDVRDKIKHFEEGKDELHPIIQKIIQESTSITEKYAGMPLWYPQKINLEEMSTLCEVVFIALHGRPGEDGSLQFDLDKYNIPYNGSGVSSSKITINKYETNEILRKNGISVAAHDLVYKKDFLEDENIFIELESKYQYPIIAKPADDGCSSAVKKIKDKVTLEAFAEMMFRPSPEFLEKPVKILQLKLNEEFPQKDYFLIESLIEKGKAKHFLEITGGFLTHYDPQSQATTYEMFEPSETLAFGDVLSLEEKFLAGEGQNITPARYSANPLEQQQIAQKVKEGLKKVAQLLKVEGYARIDAFVRIFDNFEIELIIIEVNSLPGMTPATCIFHQSALNGYKPYDFIHAILSFGMEKKKLSQVRVQ